MGSDLVEDSLPGKADVIQVEKASEAITQFGALPVWQGHTVTVFPVDFQDSSSYATMEILICRSGQTNGLTTLFAATLRLPPRPGARRRKWSRHLFCLVDSSGQSRIYFSIQFQRRL